MRGNRASDVELLAGRTIPATFTRMSLTAVQILLEIRQSACHDVLKSAYLSVLRWQ
jgi:hypothetical protein